MPVHPPREDRRRVRSDNVQAALELQLAAAAQRAGFGSIALADDLGLLVAGAGRSASLEKLAALAPRLVLCKPTYHGLVGKCRRLLSVVTVGTSHGPLYLAAVGGRSQDVPKELFGSGRGISRILGAWR